MRKWIFFVIFVISCLWPTQAQRNEEDDSDSGSRQTPQFCNDAPYYGTGRATFHRYYYKPVSNNCVHFTFTGGEARANNFRSKEECERVCVRRGSLPRDLMTCDFQANLGRECMLKTQSDFLDVSLCLNLPINNMTEDKCNSLGCCWGYGFCFQKGSSLVKSTCAIRYATSTLLWGKIDFQSDDAYPVGWIGSLTFSSPIDGELCMVRDQMAFNYVAISNTTLGDRRKFILPGAKPLFPGEQVAIVFSVKMDQSHFSTSQCKYISQTNNTVITSA